jgi:hypothetical protein
LIQAGSLSIIPLLPLGPINAIEPLGGGNQFAVASRGQDVYVYDLDHAGPTRVVKTALEYDVRQVHAIAKDRLVVADAVSIAVVDLKSSASHRLVDHEMSNVLIGQGNTPSEVWCTDSLNREITVFNSATLAPLRKISLSTDAIVTQTVPLSEMSLMLLDMGGNLTFQKQSEGAVYTKFLSDVLLSASIMHLPRG